MPETNDGPTFVEGPGHAPRPETINLAKARELLARAVETQGRDFVYNPNPGVADCFYRVLTPEDSDYDADHPSSFSPCLVGVALDLHGETRHRDSQQSITELAEGHPDMMTDAAAQYFAGAQFAQDTGTAWGASYDRAEEGVNDGRLFEAEE